MVSPFDPNAEGGPPNSDTSTTALAPAFCALNAFVDPAQSPDPVEPL